MWPKAFTQLIELAPHISRLLPMADRFFQSKTAAEDAQRRTLDSLSASFEARLQAFTEASQQQNAQIVALGAEQTAQFRAMREALDRTAADTHAARLASEGLAGQLGRDKRLFPLLVINCLLLVAVLVLLVVVLGHLR